MITNNVYHRVFCLKVGDQTGTCFSLDIENRQYIITAKHLIKEWDFNKEIQILHENQWKNIKFNLVGQSEDPVDIAVLSAPVQLSGNLLLLAEHSGIICGQDVYFLGFPYGWYEDLGEINGGFPFPFVKKAIISSMSRKKENYHFHLDGHNNLGFSGGPVVFKKIGEQNFRVAAIISGYYSVPESIFVGEERSQLSYKYNTGIISSYGIEGAVKLICENPIGFCLPDSMVVLKN